MCLIKQTANNQSRRNRNWFLLLFCLTVAASCSSSTRQFLFDIPPPKEEEGASQAQQKAVGSQAGVQQKTAVSSGSGAVAINLPTPDIEKHLSWEKVQQELPAHELGGIDWSAALEAGLVGPRTLGDPLAADAAAFKYDFIIEGKKEKFNALFPHSAHTGWLGCENCHTAVFPLRRNPTRMKDMRKGESCGRCHGGVAFSLKQCKRCHINM